MSINLEKLKGSIAPVVTPFTQEGKFDEITFKKLVERQIDNGSHVISCTGTTGEPSSLTTDERIHVMRTMIEHVSGRLPVVPATGSVNYEETVMLTQKAEELGADAVMVIVPYYVRPGQEALFQHFTRIASLINIPMIIYNIPGRTATNMEPETMKRIRLKCENVIGVKEANVNFNQVNKVLRLVGRDFHVYSGIETLCFPMLTVGGAGHISATANILPRELADLYNLTQEGKWLEAQDLHYKLFNINEALFLETNPGPLKTSMELMGLCNGDVRLPLTRPSDAVVNILKQELKEWNLI